MSDEQDRIESLEAQVESLQDKVSELESDLDYMRDERNEAQDTAKERQDQLTLADEELSDLRQKLRALKPAGDDELRALAATIRTAQRTGHPDAPKHMETLLRKLGA